jgi:putative transposase
MKKPQNLNSDAFLWDSSETQHAFNCWVSGMRPLPNLRTNIVFIAKPNNNQICSHSNIAVFTNTNIYNSCDNNPMEYRRVYIKGGTYFFTLVTYHRIPIFSTQKSIEILNDAFHYTNDRMPFEIVASAILPDHMHFIWTLADESFDYSTRWRLIKSHFTRHWCKGQTFCGSASRIKKGERDVWQRRFWEHFIRDDFDLTRHIEYIHYNPVNHGYVKSPSDWQYSSFSKYVQDGLYPQDWGEVEKVWPGESSME